MTEFLYVCIFMVEIVGRLYDTDVFEKNDNKSLAVVRF